MSSTPGPNDFPQIPVVFKQKYQAAVVSVTAVIQGQFFFVKRISFDLNAHGATDSADVELPLKGGPDFTTMLARNANNTSQVPIQIYVGLADGASPQQAASIAGLTKMFDGQVDVYSIAYVAGMVTFHCRSKAAPLVDDRITSIPRNLRTTDFVRQVAARYGLTAQILLPPGAYTFTVAEVFAQQFAVGIQNPRIWDLLLRFANHDDVDVWVTGSTLYYAAPALVPRTTYDIVYGQHVQEITAQHSPLFSKNIRVEVRTYSPRTRVATITRIDSVADDAGGGINVTNVTKVVTSTPEFGTPNSNTQTISSTGSVSFAQNQVTGGAQQTQGQQGASESGPERYIYYRPGLSLEGANAFAKAQWRRISMQEYAVTTTLPLWRDFFPTMQITSLLRVHGLPTAEVNSTASRNMYYPRRLTYSIDVDGPSSVVVEAVNHELPQGAV